ncbi:MAG: phosphotransferase family protein [Actinobacteria bacterium]|nr:phosphotransferase family protein [Actinomycetota bacterium]
MTAPALDEVVETWSDAGQRKPLVIVQPLIALLERQGVAAGRPEIVLLGGGLSNCTFLLRFPDSLELVLRRPPRTPGHASAHNVLREAQLLSALAETSVPVPRVRVICDDEAVIGVPFYVMEKIDGHIPLTGLPAAATTPVGRRAFGEAVIDALATIHAVNLEATALDQVGRPNGYLERQLRRHIGLWEAYRTRELPDIATVATWLAQTLPRQSEVTLVHGDFHPANVALSYDVPTRVVAVLDWELATRGDPLSDIGYLTSLWHEDTDPPHPFERGPVTRGEGSLTRAQLVERYAAASGRSTEQHAWYEVLALWRAAIFTEGNYRRGIAEQSAELIAYGQHVPALAARAVARMELLR